MLRERKRSRKLSSRIPCRTRRTHSYLHCVTSVIGVIVFAVFPLFSCHRSKIRNQPDAGSIFSGEFGVDSSNALPGDLSIRPIPGRILAFRGLPLAVAVKAIASGVMPNSSNKDSQLPKGFGAVTVTTSDGGRVRGVIRNLVTRRGGAGSNREGRSVSVGSDVGFPWVESDIVMYEGHGDLDPIEGSRQQLFLVIEDGSDLASGLARIGDKTVSVDLENPPDLSAFDLDNDYEETEHQNGTDRYAHPDPVSPLDAFRRMMMSGDKSLPYGDGGITSASATLPEVLSQQNAFVLSYRLNRLRLVSPSASDTLLEVLMRKCRDGLTTCASWPVYPPDLADLDFLLSREANYAQPADWASSILTWVDRQPSVIGWVESSSGSHIGVALANLTGVSQKREITLISPRGSGEVKHVIIPAKAVYRTQIARNYQVNHADISNDLNINNGIGETDEAVEIRIRGRIEQRIMLQPGRLKAVPPFVSLGPALAMWRVQSWGRRVIRSATPDRQTTAQLSFVNGRWRMRFDCRTPISPDGAAVGKISGKSNMKENKSYRTSKDTDTTDNGNNNNYRKENNIITDLGELSGREAITIFVGPYSKPRCVMSVFPDGRLLMWDSDREINEKILHDEFMMQTRDNDRSWSVAFNLPDWWLEDDDSIVELGYVRTHEETRAGDCYPYPCLPWRLNPGRVRVDLSLWNP